MISTFDIIEWTDWITPMLIGCGGILAYIAINFIRGKLWKRKD